MVRGTGIGEAAAVLRVLDLDRKATRHEVRVLHDFLGRVDDAEGDACDADTAPSVPVLSPLGLLLLAGGLWLGARPGLRRREERA